MKYNVPTLDIDKQLGPVDNHGRWEREFIYRLLNHIIKGGYTIHAVHDGDGMNRVQSLKGAMELVFNLDECKIVIRSGMAYHWVYIVRGNEVFELVADYSFSDSDADGFEACMEAFNKISDEYNCN